MRVEKCGILAHSHSLINFAEKHFIDLKKIKKNCCWTNRPWSYRLNEITNPFNTGNFTSVMIIASDDSVLVNILIKIADRVKWMHLPVVTFIIETNFYCEISECFLIPCNYRIQKSPDFASLVDFLFTPWRIIGE